MFGYQCSVHNEGASHEGDSRRLGKEFALRIPWYADGMALVSQDSDKLGGKGNGLAPNKGIY